jgi:hypothetical protein
MIWLLVEASTGFSAVGCDGIQRSFKENMGKHGKI